MTPESTSDGTLSRIVDSFDLKGAAAYLQSVGWEMTNDVRVGGRNYAGEAAVELWLHLLRKHAGTYLGGRVLSAKWLEARAVTSQCTPGAAFPEISFATLH